MNNKSTNQVLLDLAILIEQNRDEILKNNQADLKAVNNIDASLLDRLKVDNAKINGMIQSLKEVAVQVNPVGKILY